MIGSIQLVLIGDRDSGKKALLKRFADGEFDTEKSFYETHFQKTIDSEELSFEVTTTNKPNWNNGNHAIRDVIQLFVFDATSSASYKEAEKNLEINSKHASDNQRFALVATKTDLVPTDDPRLKTAYQFAALKNIQYYETSAKNDRHCDLPFQQAINYKKSKRPTLTPISAAPVSFFKEKYLSYENDLRKSLDNALLPIALVSDAFKLDVLLGCTLLPIAILLMPVTLLIGLTQTLVHTVMLPIRYLDKAIRDFHLKMGLEHVQQSSLNNQTLY